MLPRWLEEKEDAKELLKTAQAIFNKVVPTTVPVVLVFHPDLVFLLWFSQVQFRRNFLQKLELMIARKERDGKRNKKKK